MSYRGRGRGRGGYNNNGNRDSDTTEIEIRGWTNASKDEIVRYLQDKSGIRLTNVYVDRDLIKARVKNQDSRAIAQWDGRRFAGQNLRITVKDSPSGAPSAAAQSTIETLKRFLESRYNREAKLLDLKGMGQDQYLIEHGLLATTERGSKMFLALLKIAGDTYSQVDSVDLSHNSIANISGITTLSQTYPQLKNLSLAGNLISQVSDLEGWRHKFTSLRELVLQGNPITNQPGYRDQVAELFSRLVVLDGNVIRDESQIGKVKYPIPVRQTFFENDNIQQVVGGFLANYFQMYDSDRQGLLQLYDPQSTFSVAVANNTPRTMAKGLGQPPWGKYIPLSRNMTKCTTASARANRLYIGPEQIGRAFSKLPKTKHDLGDPSKFAIDAWTLNGVREPQDTAIFASVHGEYEENMIGNKSDVRSFDRTFVLLPAPNGSFIIASDILMARSYAGKDGWTSTPLAGAAGAAAGPTDDFAGLNPDQALIVRQLMEATRLTAKYARMCAEQGGFVPEQTMQLFKQAQESGALPPDAFQ